MFILIVMEQGDLGLIVGMAEVEELFVLEEGRCYPIYSRKGVEHVKVYIWLAQISQKRFLKPSVFQSRIF